MIKFTFKQLVGIIASGSHDYFNENRDMWLYINQSYENDKITYHDWEVLTSLADVMAESLARKAGVE